MPKRIPIDKGISIYKPENSEVWHIDINLQGRKRTRFSLDTRERETALALARQQVQEMHTRRTGVVVAKDIDFDRLREVYTLHAEARNEPGTRELNYANLDRIVAWMKKRIEDDRELRYSDFTPEAIEEYMLVRKKEGITPDTINRERGTLSSFFARAKKQNLIRMNPILLVDPLPITKKRIPRTIEPEEIEKLLEAAEAPVELHGRGEKGRGHTRERLTPIHDLIFFILNTSARLSEALYFEWTDIDFRQGLIRLVNKEEHRIKGRDERVVRANGPLLELLRSRKLSFGRCRWVFPSSEGGVIDRKNILRELKVAARKARVEKVNFIILRHTALTAAAQSGAPPFVLKEMAGHSSIRTTERFYIGGVNSSKWTPPVVGG